MTVARRRPARLSARCRQMLTEISKYLDDELPRARRRTVERHMGSCACCGSMARRFRTTMMLSRAERRPLPRGVRRRAATRIRRLLRSSAFS